MTENTEKKLEFVCRDCGAKFTGDKVMVPGTEPFSDEKTPIHGNQCPKCGGVLDLHFPEAD